MMKRFLLLLFVIITLFFSLSVNTTYAADDDWFRYDDYNRIPKLNHNITKALYRTNRGNEDVDAFLRLEIDYPHGYSEFDGIIRDLISKTIFEHLETYDDTKSSFFYMPGDNAYSMLDYYGISYINHLNKTIPVYVTDSLAFETTVAFYRVAESDFFVTYRDFTYHDNPLYSAMAHEFYTESFYTLSKESYERIDFNTIVLPSKSHHVKEILLNKLAKAFSERREERQYVADVLQSAAEVSSLKTEIQSLVDETEFSTTILSIDDFPIYDIAILPNGLLFHYPKYAISYGYEGDYSIIIDYEDLVADLRPEIKKKINSFYKSLSDTKEEEDSVSDSVIRFVAKGDYDSAEECLNKALSKRDNSPISIRRTQLLALIQAYRGETGFAIETYNSLLSRMPTTININSYWTESFTYAILNYRVGNQDRGKEIIEQLKKQTKLRPVVFEHYTHLLLAASIEHSTDIDEKVHYADIEYQMDTTLFGENITSRANYLSRKSQIFFVGEKWEEALKLYDELLGIMKSGIGALYPYEIYGSSQLQVQSHRVWDIQKKRALIYSTLGDIPKAISTLEDGYIQLWGKREMEDVYYGDMLSKLYLQANNTDKAVEIADKCFSRLTDYTRRAATSMTLDERNELYDFCSTWLLESFPYLLTTAHQDDHSGQLFNAAMIGKSIKVSAERNLYDLLLSSHDSNAVKEYMNLKSLLQEIDDAIYHNQIEWVIDSLKTRYYAAEKKLSEHSAVFGNYLNTFETSYKDIKERLSKKEAAIEFINFIVGDEVVYYALVLLCNITQPIAIKLFSSPISRPSSQMTIYDAYEKVWAPIFNRCKGIQTYYFSPSGVLSTSPIESSPEIPSNYSLIRVSSSREILNGAKQSINKKRDAILFGGINYDYSGIPNNLKRQKNAIDGRQKSDGEIYIGRGSREYLPGTLEEVQQIGAALNKQKTKVTSFTGDNGSEANFKMLSGTAHDILHIATHGFYFHANEASRHGNENYIRQFDNTISLDDNDLSRSGLLMSGANRVLEGHAVDNPFDDGILSSVEISRLDFTQIDLVVLSACKSGLGEIAKDGVVGLQRGFKKAGAKTLLLSLWDVDDKATSLLMKHFYDRVLAGSSYRVALKQAQHYLQEYDNGGYSHYKYWAAWVIID